MKCLKYNFSIIGITETWLQDDTSDLYTLAGYNLVEKHRIDKTGGGVCVFVNESISFMERNDLSFCDGLSPDRRHGIIGTNVDLLLTGPLGTNFNQIWMKKSNFFIQENAFEYVVCEMAPFSLGLNEWI